MSNSTKPFRMGFLLMPEYAMLTFASLIDPLRIANRMAGQTMFGWDILTLDDEPACASNGVAVSPTNSIQNTHELDGLIVVASHDAKHHHTQQLTRILQQLKQERRIIGAASGGTINLAMAGVINDLPCTTHWEFIDTFKEEFPNLKITTDIYNYNSISLTCSGGTAAVDMMLHFIAEKCGTDIAKQVAAQCIHLDKRPSSTKQSIIPGTNVLPDELNCKQLVKAIAVMQDNMEEPLSCKEIARRSGFSLRQMERKFKEKLGYAPNQFYVKMRLHKARLLIEQSDMRLIDISTACGFISASHFTQCYKRTFHSLPSDIKYKRALPTA